MRRGTKDAECRRKEEQSSSQVLQNQIVSQSAWPHYRGKTMAESRLLGPVDSVKALAAETRRGPPGSSPAHVWYRSCVTSNPITARLRQPGAKIEAKANLNAWANQLIEQAYGPHSADWSKDFDRPSPGKSCHSSSKIKLSEQAECPRQTLRYWLHCCH